MAKRFLFFIVLIFSSLLYVKGQHRGLFIPDGNGGVMEATREKRVALVIGNKDYLNGWGQLTAPVADAELMEKSLQACGFEVIRITNAGRTVMLDAIRQFSSKISGMETVALFYYAGHGLEVERNNYIIPIDDKSGCRDELLANGISLEYVLSRMKNSGAAMSLMIVDACRNQPLPFTCPLASRSIQSKSFVEYRPSGTFIAFSTAPGQTAEDILTGTPNSPYTYFLSNAIQMPGLKIEDVFKQVNREMKRVGQQEPWVNNAYYGDFYFISPKVSKPDEKLVKTGDRDGDGVLDDFDECPDQPGPVKNGGCPEDKDKDGVLDEFDDCPDQPGPLKNGGCPEDRDKDGVADNIDQCPDIFGSTKNKGCPEDRDQDGVPDETDKCPEESGTAANNGCPEDRDKDGVPDNMDQCPDIFGSTKNKGCPEDRDQDGVPDETDKCPDEFGTAANNGCPEDRDKDGVPDNMDQCPDMSGSVKNKGCPEDTDQDGVPDELDKCPDQPGPGKKWWMSSKNGK